MKPITTNTLVLDKSTGVQAAKPKGFASSWRSLSYTLVMLFSLFAVKATAVPIVGTLTSSAGSLTKTGTCVDGYFCSGWPTGVGSAGTWTWHINGTSYQNIKFQTATSSSGTFPSGSHGPNKAIFQWSIDNVNWNNFDTVNYSGTGCLNTGLNSLPTGPTNNAPDVWVRAIMTGATASGSTNRMDSTAFSGTVSGHCTNPPTAGTISATQTSFCTNTTASTTITLSGATVDAGVAYQLQDSSSATSGAWVNVGGTTTSTSFSTGSFSVSTWFRVQVTCDLGGTVFTNKVKLTINALPSTGTLSVTPANSITNPLIVGVSGNFDANSTVDPNGSWSGGGSVDPITGMGHVTAGGTTVLTYTVVDGTTLCVNSASINVYAAWDNTLALYQGINGNSTTVITDTPAAVASALVATGFTSTTPCTNGGLSGLKVSTNDSVYSAAGPHVSYKVKPTSGSALNVMRIKAVTRVSSTGPTQARLAYKIGAGSWVADSAVAQLDGSCGANTNDWFWTLGGPTLTGITDSIEIGIFPYDPGSSTGTFQVQQLEAYGYVSTNANCTSLGGSIERGHIRSLSNTHICDSGSRTLELVQHGGVGISYQWKKATTAGGAYSIVPGATGAFLNTGVLTDSAWYYVDVICSGGSTVQSDTVHVDVISGLHNHDSIRADIVSPFCVGTSMRFDSVFVNQGGTPDSVKYLSLFSGVGGATTVVDASTGEIAFNYPAKKVRITRLKYLQGCTVATTDTVDLVHCCAIAYYLGDNGTSTDVTDVQNVISTDLTATGFTTGTACSSGGLSGLTGAPSSFSTSGAHVSFKIKVNGVSDSIMIINGIKATVRSSGSGPDAAHFAYRVYISGTGWGNWVDEGQDQSITQGTSCGVSNAELYWGGAGTPVPSFAYLFNGLYDSVEVGIFPYGGTPTGTFQVNSLTVCGEVRNWCLNTIDIEDAGGSIIGVTLPVGTDAVHVTGTSPVNTFWGIIPDANNPVYAYFDYHNITTGDNSANLNVVSCFPSASVFAIAEDASGCLDFVEDVTNFVCTPKPSAVSDAKNSSVKFYPNPATSKVSVVANGKVDVAIFGVDGKLLIRQKDARTINISSLTNGMYFIKAYNDQNQLIKTEKLIKE